MFTPSLYPSHESEALKACISKIPGWDKYLPLVLLFAAVAFFIFAGGFAAEKPKKNTPDYVSLCAILGLISVFVVFGLLAKLDKFC